MNAIKLYRVGRWFYLKKFYLVAKFFQLLTFLIYNSKIPPSSEIGPGTYFVCKGISVVVMDHVKIGNNCRFGIGARIVRKFPYKNVAKIGDNVFIGPGVVISGPVIIGDNVIIAPNSVVTKSIKSGLIVGGIPAKIIGKTSDLGFDILSNPKYLEGWSDYLK